MKDKQILDVCCGGKMFWFNKNHPNVVYNDKYVKDPGHNHYRPNHKVSPDTTEDFRDLGFDDKSFKLVVFDPPHFITDNDTTNSAKLYGTLSPDTWKEDLLKGFNECWRVLDDNGVLVFKWHDTKVKIKEVLELFPEEPLFGNRQGTKLKTHWMVFMKIK